MRAPRKFCPRSHEFCDQLKAHRAPSHQWLSLTSLLSAAVLKSLSRVSLERGITTLVKVWWCYTLCHAFSMNPPLFRPFQVYCLHSGAQIIFWETKETFVYLGLPRVYLLWKSCWKLMMDRFLTKVGEDFVLEGFEKLKVFFYWYWKLKLCT